MKPKLRYFVSVLVLALLYIAAAKLGLSLALTVKQITTVWPPSGLALVALILYGYRLWPGVFIGAFIANLLTAEPVGVALGIAIGNTLEAVAGAVLLRRIISLRPALNRIKDVVGLLLLAALVSTTIAASIGTTSLALGGLVAWSDQPKSWLLWWFGDMAGDLLFAPLLLVWHSGWHQLSRRNGLEASALFGSAAVVATLVFFDQLRFLGSHPSISYLIFPFVIWAAFRFKQLGVTAITLITSIIAVLGTVEGRGPFTGVGTVEQQLITLLLYIILITASGLFMAVAVLQRERYGEELANQARDLEVARDSVLEELDAKAENERHLQDSNERVVDILERLLDGTPSRSNRDL